MGQEGDEGRGDSWEKGDDEVRWLVSGAGRSEAGREGGTAGWLRCPFN